MENSKFLKVIILILAGLTIWNTFRIESTLEEGPLFTESAEDSLAVTSTPSGSDLEGQIAELTHKVSELQRAVNDQKSKIERLSRQSNSDTRGSGRNLSRSSSPSQSNPKVEAKVRVENRYVQGTTHLPSGKNGITGSVTVEVKMNRVGMVGSVKVTSSTINDEEILNSCKEAALKTDFAYNPEAPDTSIGSITYIFN